MREKSDISGQKFGNLTATSIDSIRNRKTYWNCVCDCGTVKTVSLSNLVSGNTFSCGCSRRLDYGEGSKNALINRYKQGAKDRNIDFILTDDDCTKLFKGNCAYCGAEPSQVQAAPERGYGEYIYNGIDRVDNDLGYVRGNCVSCCKMCNLAKRDVPLNLFIEWVHRVSRNIGETT